MVAHPPPVAPSEAREEAEALHREIRDALRWTLDALARLRASQPGAANDVQQAARAVAEVVRRHNEVENQTLTPVLERIDAWGHERVQVLEEAHRSAEQAIDSVDSLPVDWTELENTIETLVHGVLRALRIEEREVLDPELLRDDPIICDQIDG